MLRYVEDIMDVLNDKDATTVRLTQTFQLPFPIDLGKVEVIPTSNRGQDVRVNV